MPSGIINIGLEADICRLRETPKWPRQQAALINASVTPNVSDEIASGTVKTIILLKFVNYYFIANLQLQSKRVVQV